MKHLLTYPLILIILFSCKTAEEIEREKLVDTLKVQVSEGQKSQTEYTMKLNEFQERLEAMFGKMEESQHEFESKVTEAQKISQESLTAMEERVKSMEESFKEMQEAFDKQKKYIDRVTKTLKGIGGSSSKASKDILAKARGLLNRKKYKEARSEFKTLLGRKGLTAVQRVKINHGIGTASYHLKDYDEALIAYSKIITKYPRSSYAPSSFYYIGMSFKRQKNDKDAKEAFNQVVTGYPKSRFVKLAKKQLESIK